MNWEGRPRLLSNAEVARMRNLKRGGTSAQTIAALLGVSRATVHRRLTQAYKQPERRW